MIKIIQIVVIFSLFNSCQSQEKGITKNENIDLLEQVWSNVNEHFYDQNFQGIDWDKKHIE